MEKITALAVPRHAYNPTRRMSSLLRSQVDILQQAVIDAIDSEEEVAHAITTLSALLQELRPQIVHVRTLQSAVYDAIDTEAEAALCIQTLNGLLKELRPHVGPSAYSATARKRTRKRASGAGRKKPTSRRKAGAKK